MQRLFFPSLIVPFVLVSIISLFGLADFQLEAASPGAERLQHSQGKLQKITGLCMCFAAGKRTVLSPRCFPCGGGSNVLRCLWLFTVGGSLWGPCGACGGNSHAVVAFISIRNWWGTASFQVLIGILAGSSQDDAALLKSLGPPCLQQAVLARSSERHQGRVVAPAARKESPRDHLQTGAEGQGEAAASPGSNAGAGS